jgi:hypothetical protein
MKTKKLETEKNKYENIFNGLMIFIYNNNINKE